MHERVLVAILRPVNRALVWFNRWLASRQGESVQ